MEYLMSGELWREVGLTVAARLSIVAVALWAVKMVTDHLRESIIPRPLPTIAAPAVTNLVQPVSAGASDRLAGYRLPAAVARRLSLKKTESDSWREKMGKYLSGEPVVTSTSPHRQQ